MAQSIRMLVPAVATVLLLSLGSCTASGKVQSPRMVVGAPRSRQTRPVLVRTRDEQPSSGQQPASFSMSQSVSHARSGAKMSHGSGSNFGGVMRRRVSSVERSFLSSLTEDDESANNNDDDDVHPDNQPSFNQSIVEQDDVSEGNESSVSDHRTQKVLPRRRPEHDTTRRVSERKIVNGSARQSSYIRAVVDDDEEEQEQEQPPQEVVAGRDDESGPSLRNGSGNNFSPCTSILEQRCCSACPYLRAIYLRPLIQCCGFVLIAYTECPRYQAMACGVHGLDSAGDICDAKSSILKCMRDCPCSYFGNRCLDQVVVCRERVCKCGYSTLLTFDNLVLSSNVITTVTPGNNLLPAGLAPDNLAAVDIIKAVNAGYTGLNVTGISRNVVVTNRPATCFGGICRRTPFGVNSLFVATAEKRSATVEFRGYDCNGDIVALKRVYGVSCSCPTYVVFGSDFAAISRFVFKMICSTPGTCPGSGGVLRARGIVVDNMSLCL